MLAIRRARKAQRWKKGGDPPIISFSMNTSNVSFSEFEDKILTNLVIYCTNKFEKHIVFKKH